MDASVGAVPDGRRVAWASGRAGQVADTLVLVYNMACPLKCDFCCHPVEEYGPVKIERERAIDWIRQAAATGTCRLVAFTGGEPFLYYADLLEILGATQGLGLGFRIVTAAHWADSMPAARDRLRPLVHAGLTELTISTDPSHQVFVPARQAEFAARAAVELGLQTEVAGVFWDPTQAVEDTVDVPVGALTTRRLVTPVGRAAVNRVTAEDYGLGPERFFGCGTPGNYDVTIYADGEVYPCCSGGFNIQAGLSFGNARHEPLERILTRMHADRYTRLVLNVGLGPLWDLARLRFPEIHARLPPLDGYVSICQACARVHADEALMRELEPVLAYADSLFGALDELQSSPRVPAVTAVHP